MPYPGFIGTYSVVGYESTTFTYLYSTVDELLLQIQTVGLIAASAASASAFFQNSDPTTIAVGGIPVGSTFPTPKTMQEMFDDLLYPYVAPLVTTSTSLADREFGQTPIPSANVSWTITKKKLNITSVSFSDGHVPVFTSGSQIQTRNFSTATYSQTPGVSQTNTFGISVGDGTTTVNSNVTLTWQNKIYWGKINLTSLGNPNLTSNPSLASSVGLLATDTIIKNLTGAGAGGYGFGNILSTSINGPYGAGYNGIDGGGQYLIFAWPSNFINAMAPTFTVNGLITTAFTRVRTNSVFSNQYGFTGTRYEVWVSNTLQNSPISSIQIS